MYGGSGQRDSGPWRRDDLIWRQLTDAKMIPFGSTADGTCIDTTTLSGGTATTEIALLTPLLPQLRIRPTGFVFALGVSGINYFAIGVWNGGGSTGGLMKTNAVLSPREAQGIDQKLDDGFPASGTVVSILSGQGNVANGGSPVTASDTLCYDNSTTNGTYATSTEDIASGIRCS